MQDDTRSTFKEILQRSGQSLVEQMVKIQQHTTSHSKSEVWATHLRFLKIPDSDLNCPRSRVRYLLRTHWSEVPDTKDYVAVSYTWDASEHEDRQRGGYMIKSGTQTHQSKIRDNVLYRTICYALANNAELIWIDQECINQNDEQDKEIGLQSMDLVYSRSSFPVGLLSISVESQQELNLLQSLMRQEYIQNPNSERPPKFKSRLGRKTILKVENILSRIIADRWFTRAWTYQEEYRTSGRMCLLLPHTMVLQKDENVFGKIPGELQITSKQFRTAVSEFLLACEDAGYDFDRNILRKAKQYNIVNRSYSGIGSYNLSFKAMSSTVYSDIADRNLEVCADILAIISNCCGYSVRLNAKTLVNAGIRSISTCILALYFLNGELPENGRNPQGYRRGASVKLYSCNVYEYLESVSARKIESPVTERPLTFMKRWRLPNVTISKQGIEAAGWVWELGETIYTGRAEFNRKFWYRRDTTGQTTPNDIARGRLRQMAAYLKWKGHYALADSLFHYLKPDGVDYPSKPYKDIMAETIGNEIHQGGVLVLGRLVGQKEYRALFLTQHPTNKRFIFTTWSAHDEILDKYVTVEVSMDAERHSDVRLHTKSWINGLWFAEGTSRKRVVFPWGF